VATGAIALRARMRESKAHFGAHVGIVVLRPSRSVSV
jgi:hypothetical protein